MVFPVVDTNDEEVKEFIKKISAICTSKQFHNLRRELEKIYSRSCMENATLTAFQDALFTILAEENSGPTDISRGF